MNYIFVAFEGLKAGLGTGHIVRIKKVIDALRSSASSVESIIFISNISEQSSNYSLMRVHNLEDASDAILSCVRHKNIDLVVFDCLDCCEDVYAECSNQSIITVGIDTSSRQSVMLDILVNPVIENQLSHLRGPFYAIHQGGHYLQEQQICIESKKSIFICFGGIDYQNHFGGILPFISSLPGSYDINIVLASEHDFELAPPLRDNVNFFFRPPNFYDLLERASFAIISGGILLQECMYMGIPAYVIPQYDHQFKIAKEKEVSGMLTGVGSLQPDYRDSINFILSVIEDTSHLGHLALKSRSSDDGYGLSRVLSILKVLKYLSWDSVFFEQEIYLLETKAYTPSIKLKVDSLISEKRIDLIYFLCPWNDSESIDFAMRDGFKCVDERLTYLISKPQFNTSILDRGCVIEKSSYGDIKDLEYISKLSKWTTRYYSDDKFPRSRLKKFYSEWVKNSVLGDLDDMVFHVREAGVIAGFITIKKNGRNLGSIGLISVKEEAQGRGLGKKLVAHAVNHLLHELDCAGVEVVTQNNNIAARRTYEDIGFQVFNKSKWLHKWI